MRRINGIVMNSMMAGTVLLGGLLSRHAAEAASGMDDRPSFVVIMADDMGYSDLGCMGSEIRTPNIDKLAATGFVFERAYCMVPTCGASGSVEPRYFSQIFGAVPWSTPALTP